MIQPFKPGCDCHPSDRVVWSEAPRVRCPCGLDWKPLYAQEKGVFEYYLPDAVADSLGRKVACRVAREAIESQWRRARKDVFAPGLPSELIVVLSGRLLSLGHGFLSCFRASGYAVKGRLTELFAEKDAIGFILQPRQPAAHRFGLLASMRGRL